MTAPSGRLPYRSAPCEAALFSRVKVVVMSVPLWLSEVSLSNLLFCGSRHDLHGDEPLAGREIHAATEAGRDERPGRQPLEEIRLGDEPARGRVAPRDLLLVVAGDQGGQERF